MTAAPAGVRVRPATPGDVWFLEEMLAAAAWWRPGDEPAVGGPLSVPEVAVYLEGWGRRGDAGVVADRDGELVGAAWLRLFTAEVCGYGFIDEATPELTIAVTSHHRRRGIGRALLSTLLDQAGRDGHRRVSLSVEPDNPAMGLYESVGFVECGRRGGAVTMSCRPREHATVVVDNSDLAAPAIVHRADTDDAEELVGLRDDIARWMHDVGIRTWNPGEVQPADVHGWLDAGTVYVRREAGRIVAAVVILWEDPDIWGETDGAAGYIHNLMVARSHAGRNLGEAMLSAAESHIYRHGADLARLDAAEDSAPLQDWYVARGYRRVGVRRFDRDDVYDTVLYEKDLTAR